MEIEKRKELMEREEATESYTRDEETTLQQIDYKSVILSNINILPQNDFKTLDEFLYYVMKFNFENHLFTEENFNKIL